MSLAGTGSNRGARSNRPKSGFAALGKGILRHWQLYLLVLPPLIYIVIFRYVPMYGIAIAFKDYKITQSIAESPWVGFRHFLSLFTSYQFPRLIKNTLGLSVYSIVAGIFPPIILALGLNYCKSKFFGKAVQMITYMPYFISTVLIVGLLNQMLALNGPINTIIKSLGGDPMLFLGEAGLFKTIYVFSGIWAHNGYSAVIYLAALAGINQELYEAAIMDGATVLQRIRHIDIPGILPTATILLIMSCGNVLSVGAEKALMMQNNLNIATSDIISTFVYRVGLLNMQYSFTTAVGLFESLVSLILLTTVNAISRKVSETSLW